MRFSRLVSSVSLACLGVLAPQQGQALEPTARGIWQRQSIPFEGKSGHAMAFDEERQQVLLFGGCLRGTCTATSFTRETWLWDGKTWAFRDVPGPSVRAGHALAYTATQKRTLLFGGVNPGGLFLDDTWAWDGERWTALTKGSITGRQGALLVHDPVAKRTLLAGGNTGAEPIQETWEWNDATSSWQQLSSTSPPCSRAFFHAAKAQIQCAGEGKLWGWSWTQTGWSELGSAPDGAILDAVYRQHNQRLLISTTEGLFRQQIEGGQESWQQVPAPVFDLKQKKLVVDEARQELVTFGETREIWALDAAGQWLPKAMISPPNYTAPGMVYDTLRKRIVIFGGQLPSPVGQGARSRLVWERGDPGWIQLNPTTGPEARAEHAMLFDKKRGLTVVYGGSTQAGVVDDLWTWDGAQWAELKPAGNKPPPLKLASLVYDEQTDQYLLYGGISSDDPQSASSTLWAYNPTTAAWTSSASPAGKRFAHAAAYDALKGRMLLQGGRSVSNAIVGSTWEYKAGVWKQFTGASSGRSHHGMAFVDGSSSFRGIYLVGGQSTAPLSSVVRLNEEVAGQEKWNSVSVSLNLSTTMATARLVYDEKTFRAFATGGSGDAQRIGIEFTSNRRRVAVPVGSGPAPRTDMAVAHAPSKGLTYLLGGCVATPTQDCFAENDLWAWDGRAWEELPRAAFRPTSGHSMIHDDQTGRLIVCAPAEMSLWAWDGAVWSVLPTGDLACLKEGARSTMVLDAKSRTVFGRSYTGSNCQLESWSLDDPSKVTGGSCGELALEASSVLRFPLAYYPPGNVAFAINSFNDKVYTHKAENLSPGLLPLQGQAFDSTLLRRSSAVAFDPILQGVLVLNGRSKSSVLSDVWAWDGSSWAEVPGSKQGTASPELFLASAVFDEARAMTLLVGGKEDFGTNHEQSLSDATWGYRVYGQSCQANADCHTGNCVDGFCCLTSSCGFCESCGLPGSEGECAKIFNAPDPDTCAEPFSCDSAGACKVAIGQNCVGPANCASGFCVDGVCCDSKCDGTCQACRADLKADGPSGNCGNAKEGLDPHEDCPTDEPSTCLKDGTCDGAGACRRYLSGTACGETTCKTEPNGSKSQFGFACDGQGTCDPGVTTGCGLFECNLGVCQNPCEADLDCIEGAFCNQGVCTQQGSPGVSCSSGEECLSGFCVDGVCCTTPCSGQCEACNANGAVGTCIPVVGAPRGDRTPCNPGSAEAPCQAASCDGIDRFACKGFVGTDTVVSPATCKDGVATPLVSCNGKGSPQEVVPSNCGAYVCGPDACLEACSSDADCSSQFRCKEGACVASEGASCGDQRTLVDPRGNRIDCAPYRCEGSACLASCRSRADCAVGDCTPERTCVEGGAGLAPISPEEGGCACSLVGATGPHRSPGLLALALALAPLARRRRSPRSPRSLR
jgi:MYXO-CTERM domain-containing protein